MAEFVLGFIGSTEMDPRAATALLDDLVRSQQLGKNRLVRVFFAGETWTDTLKSLANFVIAQNYRFGLIGPKSFTDDHQGFLATASDTGNLYRVPDNDQVGVRLVELLDTWKQSGNHTRLILVADEKQIEKEDSVYDAVITAAVLDIPIRSLPGGLEEVKLDADSSGDDEEETVVKDDFYDVEDDEEVWDDDEDTPLVVKTVDELDDDLDDDELDTGATDVALVDDDDDDDDLPPIEEDDEDDTITMVFDDDDDEDEDELDDEPEVPVKRPVERMRSNIMETKPTRGRLEKLAERDYPSFKELAAQYNVFPGRGIKIPTMINRVLEAASSNGAPVKAAQKAAPKAAPAPKAARAQAHKQAAAVKSGTAAPPRQVKAAASGPDADQVLQIIDGIISTLSMLKTLL